MASRRIIAIDPGKNGGIVIARAGSRLVETFDMPQTCRDLIDFFEEHNIYDSTVVMEEVGGYIGRPTPGARMFTFGRQFGNLEAIIMTASNRLELVKPQKWQKFLSLGTSKGMQKKEWKNKLKSVAQRLYPDTDVNLRNADALLILEYARREKVVE